MWRKFLRSISFLFVVVVLSLSFYGYQAKQSTQYSLATTSLDDFFGVTRTSSDLLKLDRQREEFLQRCMAERGFSYIPVTRKLSNFPNPMSDALSYGIANKYETYDVLVLAGVNPLDPQPFNPNIEIVQSLAPDLALKYKLALEDSQQRIKETNKSQSCSVQATRAIFPANQPDVVRRAVQLFEEGSSKDPYGLTIRDWRDCMNNVGISVHDINDPILEVKKYLSSKLGLKIVEFRKGEAIPGQLQQENGNEIATENGFVTEGEPTKLSEEDLHDLRNFEKDMYRNDARCQNLSGLGSQRVSLARDVVSALFREFPFLNISPSN